MKPEEKKEETAVAPVANQQVTKKSATLAEVTMQRVEELTQNGTLQLPKDYSAPNALRAAWFMLQEAKDRNGNGVLKSCTPDSIANTLFKMVTQALNPAKRQCSFIAYGDQLTMQREYQGSIALAKRYGLKEVQAKVIYKGDTFETVIVNGRERVVNHISPFESRGGAIIGAYAISFMEDGSEGCEIMTMAQIQNSWNQGATKGASPAHKNFPDQMCMKTVIGRACKWIINSSNDADLMDEDPIAHTDTPVTASVRQEISSSANAGEVIDFEEVKTEAADLPKGVFSSEATAKLAEPVAEVLAECPFPEAK